MALPSFQTTKDEFEVICLIVDRAQGLARSMSQPGFRPRINRMSAIMDLSAVHANGNPMNFDGLLGADDFNFTHDFFGIARYLNRETGQLEDHFSPRFSQRDPIKQSA